MATTEVFKTTPWNQIFIDLIGRYSVRRKRKGISHANVSPSLSRQLVGLISTNMMIKSPLE
jgi:hypothetical protein